MRVTVHGQRHRATPGVSWPGRRRGRRFSVDRGTKQVVSQERVQLLRLAPEGFRGRREMRERHAQVDIKALQRVSQLPRGRRGALAERPRLRVAGLGVRVAGESSAGALHTGDPDLPAGGVDDRRRTVQHRQAGAGQHLGENRFLAVVMVVVTQYHDDGQIQATEQRAERRRRFGAAVVGEVAGEEEDVGDLRRALIERPEPGWWGLGGDVQVSNCCDTDHATIILAAFARPPGPS